MSTPPRRDDAPRVLVAGANGLLGRLLVDELLRRGYRVRAAARRAAPDLAARVDSVHVGNGLHAGGWLGACDGIDTVVSTVGASVDPSPFVGFRSYRRVDAPANRALLQEAMRAGVRRFVYVSLVDADQERELDYADGHELVVDALRATAIPASVMRPTGFFAAMTALVGFARRGLVPVFGDGSCRTNPIDERDLAAATADEVAATGKGLREVPLGGPEEFTRKRIAEMAFEALGKRPRLLHVPVPIARLGGRMLALVNPRGGHFTLFAAHVMTHDCLAPNRGTRRLADAFAAAARR